MFTIIATYINREKGIKLKDYEAKDEDFENDAEYEQDGFVVADDEPIETFEESAVATYPLECAQRACRFVGNYMKSMLEIFGDEYDTEEEEDEDFEPNEDSSDEDSELEQSQEEDEDENEESEQDEDDLQDKAEQEDEHEDDAAAMN